MSIKASVRFKLSACWVVLQRLDPSFGSVDHGLFIFLFDLYLTSLKLLVQCVCVCVVYERYEARVLIGMWHSVWQLPPWVYEWTSDAV